MPYSRKALYKHLRQKNPKMFQKKSFRTVPLNHSNYKGKKFSNYNRKGTKAKAIVGKLKSNKKWSTQSILIPKKRKKGK